MLSDFQGSNNNEETVIPMNKNCTVVNEIFSCLRARTKDQTFVCSSLFDRNMAETIALFNVADYLDVPFLFDSLVTRIQKLIIVRRGPWKEDLDLFMNLPVHLILAINKNFIWRKSSLSAFQCNENRTTDEYFLGMVTSVSVDFDYFKTIYPCLSQLEELLIEQSPNDGDAIAALIAQSPRLQLRRLSLKDTSLSSTGVTFLTNASHLSHLEWLELAKNNIGDSGVQAIAQSEYMSNVYHLDVSSTWLTVNGAKALGESVHMSKLTDLYLGNNYGLDATALQFITNSIHLKKLSVPGCRLGAQGADFIATSPWMSSLTVLDLSGNLIRMEGVGAIAKSEYMRNLIALDISKNEFGRDTMMEFSSSPFMNKLRVLKVSGNSIDNDGFKAIAASPYLQNLKILAAERNLADERVVRNLFQHLKLYLGRPVDKSFAIKYNTAGNIVVVNNPGGRKRTCPIYTEYQFTTCSAQ